MQAESRIAGERDLLREYAAVRGYTTHLCEPLEVEDYVPQPIVDVSPAKWNIAHTTWFFEEMILSKYLDGYRRFDDDFAFLFNSYYNSVGTRTLRDHRGDLSRPTVKRVFEYREYVDENMIRLLASPDPAFVDLVVLGINHEQQHQELLLTDLKYMLSLNPLNPAYRENYFPEISTPAGTGEYINIDGGISEIGYSGDGFCFDNELGRHKVYVDEYAICDRPVLNCEFIEFIDDGGYREHSLWHSEGWDLIHRENINAPLYWRQNGGKWQNLTLGGLCDVDPLSPVCHISYFEAAAFAEWSGKRLPTEAEWEIANDRFQWGDRWEWTNSAYLAYPGFKKGAGAVGEYNGKFMINQMVLRGASSITPAGHSRPTYRNFFAPHLRWQFMGVRLVK